MSSYSVSTSGGAAGANYGDQENAQKGPLRFLATAAAAAATGAVGYTVLSNLRKGNQGAVATPAGSMAVPAAAVQKAQPASAPVVTEPADSSKYHGGSRTYKVQAGDTLEGIARKFGTTVEVLMEANMIENPDYIGPGYVIWLPNTYAIKKGDTLSAISRKFNTTVAALVQANGIRNPDLIYEGDVLLLPAGAKN